MHTPNAQGGQVPGKTSFVISKAWRMVRQQQQDKRRQQHFRGQHLLPTLTPIRTHPPLLPYPVIIKLSSATAATHLARFA